MRAGSQGDVEAIVDEDARTGPANRIDARGNETRQRTSVEIALTNLNEMHAVVRGRAHALDERRFPGSSRSDGDRSPGREQVSAAESLRAEWRRCRCCAPGESRSSSPSPAIRLMTPSPETAPRTKLFVMTA